MWIEVLSGETGRATARFMTPISERFFRMKRVVALTAVVSVALLGVIPAASQADTKAWYGMVCTSPSNPACLNNWDSGGLGSEIHFYGQNGGRNNDWNVWYEGKVAAGTPTSFQNSYLNGQYSGNNVYKIAWAPNGVGSGWCLSSQLYTGGNGSAVNLIQCNQATLAIWWVYDGNGRLIPMSAADLITRLYGNQYRLWLGEPVGGHGNGAFVVLTDDINYSDKWFFCYATGCT